MFTLRKPALVAISVAAVAAAVCGVLLGTQASFTARGSGEPLPITAGRLAVELTTTPGRGDRISIDFADAGPGLTWPRGGAMALSLRNTGDLAGTLTRVETAEVRDGGPAGARPLSRSLEIAASGDVEQDWSDPALTWRQVATGARPGGHSIATHLGDLPVGQTRTVYFKVRFAATADEADAYAGTTTGFRLVATVRQRV